MRYLFFLLTLFTVFSFRVVDDVYNVPLKTLGGKNVHLSERRGKKMLVVVLPTSVNDSTLPRQEISSFQQKWPDITIIGALAFDAGYSKANEKEFKTTYPDSTINFILTEQQNVKKSSGSQQSPLFQWLTHKERNRHFDLDIQSAGQKFFIDEKGELYAVLSAQTRLSSPIIDKIVTKSVGR